MVTCRWSSALGLPLAVDKPLGAARA